MALYETSGGRQDFLLLNYDNVDFFVNRSQFSGSTTLNDIRTIKSSLTYINKVFKYNGNNILLFDCDQFLKDIYACEIGNKSCLCLLMRLDNFTDKNKPLIKKLLARNPRISQESLGLIITSHSEIKKLVFDEIYLSPRGVRRLLREQGLYGCRFPESGRIQYYIDLELIIINVLKGKKS
ncbi:hypothetical protein [Oceanispirochaeta sp.]|uniref:hypothetical protein n=1 Tax=Oceanispirochaeta sp. TaxID=2035350 RepID=UPI0026380179|nr:hypothetical protein [Oceanispirochaeta sp.]MDA3958953.1 hypothetical protein [Oceanispirochaeta sp.]